MRRRVRNHVNPLGLRFLDTSAERLRTRGGPIEVELGCADARFLFERAPKHPETDFIGVEIREPLVEEVNERAEALHVPNLRAVFANITTELDILFADDSLTRIYINFPDPWFKERHRRRRLMNDELAGGPRAQAGLGRRAPLPERHLDARDRGDGRARERGRPTQPRR